MNSLDSGGSLMPLKARPQVTDRFCFSGDSSSVAETEGNLFYILPTTDPGETEVGTIKACRAIG